MEGEGREIPQEPSIDFDNVAETFVRSSKGDKAPQSYISKVAEGLRITNTMLKKSTGDPVLLQYRNRDKIVYAVGRTNGEGINVIRASETGTNQIAFGTHAVILQETIKGRDFETSLIQQDALTVPEELKDKARHLVERDYGESMFYDESKETMLSIEMKDGYDLESFHTQQGTLVEDLNRLLSDAGIEGAYKVDPTTIATDVESPYVGKTLGADRFEEFLRDKGIKVDEYDTFGDSKSDFAMADALQRRGKHVKMVYVGDGDKLGNFGKDYPIDYVGGFSRGTADYLTQTHS